MKIKHTISVGSSPEDLKSEYIGRDGERALRAAQAASKSGRTAYIYENATCSKRIAAEQVEEKPKRAASKLA